MRVVEEMGGAVSLVLEVLVLENEDELLNVDPLLEVVSLMLDELRVVDPLLLEVVNEL